MEFEYHPFLVSDKLQYIACYCNDNKQAREEVKILLQVRNKSYSNNSLFLSASDISACVHQVSIGSDDSHFELGSEYPLESNIVHRISLHMSFLSSESSRSIPSGTVSSTS